MGIVCIRKRGLLHSKNVPINNQQDASSIQNFILSRNSTCCGHLLCPSSGVISCKRGNWYVSCRLCGRCLGNVNRCRTFSPMSQPATFPVQLLCWPQKADLLATEKSAWSGVTDKEWHKTRHSADNTRQHLSNLIVIYVVGSPTWSLLSEFSTVRLISSCLIWCAPHHTFTGLMLHCP
jgi:hypothetical protein